MTAPSIKLEPARIELEPVYQRARVWGGLLGATGLGVLAVLLRWAPGAVVGVMALAVAGHAWRRSRHPGRSAVDSLLVDATVLALGLLVARPPGLVVVPPLAYVVVIAPLALSKSRAAWVVFYAIVTSGVSLFLVQRADPPDWALGETLLVVALSTACTVPPMFRMLQAAGRAVSETERLGRSLKEREERYRSLVEASPMPIAVHCEGRVVYANQATADLVGAASPSDMVGTQIMDYVHPDDHEVVRQRMRQVVEEGRPVPVLGERFVRLDGEVIEVEVAAIPILFEGRPASQVVVRDVTAHKRAEQAAQARSEELGRLFSLTAAINAGRSVSEILDGIFDTFQELIPYDRVEYADLEEQGRLLRTRWVRTGYEGTLLEVGHEYRRSRPITISGADAHPFVDNDLISYSLSKPEDNPTRLLVKEGIRSALSCPLVVGDMIVGYLFFASQTPDAYLPAHAILVHRVAGQIAAALEQSRLREELVARNQELEELNRTRTQFLANVSHELRTPLTAVVGLSSEMRDRLHRLTGTEVNDFSELIAAGSAEVAGIVEDLLVIARAEAGQLTVIPENINLPEIIHLAVSTWDHQESKRVSVKGEAVEAWADPLRVRQIIRNLCTNARRYGGDRIEVRIRSDGPTTQVIVADDGPGIPDGEREAIFHAYVAAKSDRTRSSVGLGLTVSRQLARAMNGDLTYTYRDGESRFLLSLPSLVAGFPAGEQETAGDGSPLGSGLHRS